MPRKLRLHWAVSLRKTARPPGSVSCHIPAKSLQKQTFAAQLGDARLCVLETSLETALETALETSLDTWLETSLDTSLETSLETALGTSLDTWLDTSLDTFGMKIAKCQSLCNREDG